jgi:hypothetical protein
VITSFIFVILFIILLAAVIFCIGIFALFVIPYTYATCEDIDDPFGEEKIVQEPNKKKD